MNLRSRSALSFVVLWFFPCVALSQWIQTIDSATVVSFAVDEATLFAGADEEPLRVAGFKIFSSTNSGASWTILGSLGGTKVNALAVSGTNLFAGTHGGFCCYGVYRSTNNGASWVIAWPNIITEIYSLAVNGTRLFAGTGNGVYLSTDDGATWIAVNHGLLSTFGIVLAVNGTNLFAGTDGGGVYLSTNDGTNWIPASTGLTNTRVTALTANGSNVFAGTWGGGVFLSTDNGGSWTPVNNGLAGLNVFSLTANGTNLFAGTGPGGGVFHSTNNGTTWTTVNDRLDGIAVLAIAVSGGNLYAGTWGHGVWRRPLSELVSVEGEQTKFPKSFVLEQNYPNPFNPTTSVTFDLPRRSHVVLSVYDLLGREIAVLIDEMRDAGRQSVEFQAGRHASGVYLYRLKADGFVQVLKMVLQK